MHRGLLLQKRALPPARRLAGGALIRGVLGRGFGFPLALLLALMLLAGRPRQAGAGAVLSPQVEHRFGEYVRISLQMTTDRPVAEVLLFVHPQGTLQTYTHTMEPDGDGWTYRFSPQVWPIPAFALVYYWFQITYQDGGQETTPSYTFTYTDNRFAWKQLTLDPLTLYWYAGPEDLPQTVLNAAFAAMQRVRSQWYAPRPAQVEIYLYQDPAAYQSLTPNQPEWAQAHTLGHRIFLLANLDVGSLERYVAHEMGHVMQYAAVGRRVHRLPWWLQEGLASLAEPDLPALYQQALNTAALQGTWLPLASLCMPPQAADQALRLLAYAEAASFVGFLHRTYGPEALARLVQAYAGGAACEQGVQQVLGQTLPELEQAWKARTWVQHPGMLRLRIAEWTVGVLGIGLLLLSTGASLYWLYRQGLGSGSRRRASGR